MRSFFAAVAVLAVLSFGAVNAFGQAETGQIVGTVQDPAAASIPGATVTVRSASTGAERTETTDQAGGFTFTNLLPDAYDVTVAAAGFTYYNIPLLETGRPTIGANQYGIFIQAFGLLRWRAIERIDLVEIAERAMTVHELQIALNTALTSALVADWRKQPIHRLLMRLPWRMDHKGVLRVSLEPFDRPPDEIHRTFLRMWRFYRS